MPKMENVRIEEEDIKFGLFCGQFPRRSGARMEISKIEFEEVNVIFASGLSELLDDSHGLVFASGSQVHLRIVFRDSLQSGQLLPGTPKQFMNGTE